MMVSLCHYCKKKLGVLVVNGNPCCQFCAEEIQGVDSNNNKQNGVDEDLIGWDENVKSFVKEKQMTKEVQKKFLEEYDSYLFRGGLDDVEWFYNEIYGGNK